MAFMMVISLALILLCVFEWEADETCLFYHNDNTVLKT